MRKIITKMLLIGLFLASSNFGLQAAKKQVDPRSEETLIAETVNGHIWHLFNQGYSMEDRKWYVDQNVKIEKLQTKVENLVIPQDRSKDIAVLEKTIKVLELEIQELKASSKNPLAN